MGYGIGSIMPSYLLGKLKKTDIRTLGTGNAGTTNTFQSLGLVYAIPTAFIDTMKGVFSILIALILGADFIFGQIAGFAAIVGHVFPFYMRFKGGKGVACAAGIMLYYFLDYIATSLAILHILFFW